MEMDAVWNAFRQLTGLEEAEAQSYRGLVELTATEFLHKLRPEVDPTEHAPLLTQLAAVTACCRYGMLQDTGASSVRAGDLSVTLTGGKTWEGVTKLKEELTALAGELLRDDQFVFEVME